MMKEQINCDRKSKAMQSENRLKASEPDETEYLLKSKANRERLDRAKINIDNKVNLIEIDLEDLAIAAKRKNEPTTSHDDFLAELKQEGLI